jgi:hypothetical protein
MLSATPARDIVAQVSSSVLVFCETFDTTRAALASGPVKQRTNAISTTERCEYVRQTAQPAFQHLRLP